MSAVAIPRPDTTAEWRLPDRGTVGMACLIIAEAAIFTIFVVAYLYYVGKSLSGPTPREVLETPILFTICLLSSSLTIHFAGKALERGARAARSWGCGWSRSCSVERSCSAPGGNGTG